MGRKRLEVLEVGELQGRIEVWRASRAGRSRMPGDLWDEAVTCARQFGACRVARDLGICYATLRRKLNGPDVKQAVVGTGADGGGFVELGFGAWNGPSLVEVTGRGECRLSIRVVPGAGLDVAAVVSAFLRDA